MIVSKETLDELTLILKTDAYFHQYGPGDVDITGIVARESGIYARDDGFYLGFQLMGYSEKIRFEKIESSRTLPGERVTYFTLEGGKSEIVIMSVHELVLRRTRETFEKELALALKRRVAHPDHDWAAAIAYNAEEEKLTRIGP